MKLSAAEPAANCVGLIDRLGKRTFVNCDGGHGRSAHCYEEGRFRGAIPHAVENDSFQAARSINLVCGLPLTVGYTVRRQE